MEGGVTTEGQHKGGFCGFLFFVVVKEAIHVLKLNSKRKKVIFTVC